MLLLVERVESWLRRLEMSLIVVLFPGLVLLTSLQVLFRYVLNYPLPWSEELAVSIFIWVAFIGSAVAMAEKGHFGLTLILTRLPPIARILAEIFIWSLSAVFLLLVAGYGISVVLETSHTMTTLPVSMQWSYSAVPVGAILMLLHLALHVGKAVLQQPPSSA
jgi:TRAP-type C4-dicarboxylate transport system permease small subunit